MKYFLFTATILYLFTVVFEISFCLMMEASRRRLCDKMFVGAVSTFVTATTLVTLTLLLRALGVL